MLQIWPEWNLFRAHSLAPVPKMSYLEEHPQPCEKVICKYDLNGAGLRIKTGGHERKSRMIQTISWWVVTAFILIACSICKAFAV